MKAKRIRRPTMPKRCGRWTVLQFYGIHETPGGHKLRVWFCRCDCGTERLVLEGSLRNGSSTSCGCYNRERTIQTHTKHGESNKKEHPEYAAWSAMLERCYSTSNDRYKDYGGRDILVCDRWRHNFNAFLADMGRRPAKGYSLDRIDNDKGYSPENCRWATSAQQMTNLRNTLMIGGIPLARLAHLRGIKPTVLRLRIIAGWNIQDALSRPVRHKAPNGSGRITRATC